MSYCELKTINRDGTIETFEEYRNAHGGAPFIWDKLAKKYLGVDSWIILKDMNRLWKLLDDDRLEECEKVALLITWDYATLKAKNLDRASKALTQFIELHPSEHEYICHIESWAKDLIRIKSSEVMGTCFYHCSVSEDVWDGYNAKTGKEHFCVYDEIE